MAEVPLLKQLYWKYQDRGLSLVGIALDEDRAKVERTVKERGIFWPQICDGKADEGQVPKLYNVQGTPDLFVIDRGGRIAARVHNAHVLDEQLAEVVSEDPFPPRTQRDTWQRPVRIMEDLGIQPGKAVADVGAGGGYFTFRLAARVGPKGKVYAVDIDEQALAKIREQADKDKLAQVQVVVGAEDDPRLSAASLDAVLVVDAFHEFRNAGKMVAAFYRALKPGGKLGIVDRSGQMGLSRAVYLQEHRLPQELLIEDLSQAGFRLASFQNGFAGPSPDEMYYFGVFEKPKP